MKRISLIGTALLFLLVWTPGASAVPYGFTNITNNNPGDAEIGEAQLFLDVDNSGVNQVLFTFTNTGPAASSITDIYFDDDVPLISFAQFIPSPGVVFTKDANPSNLPGGNDPLYHFSSNYSYDPDNPVQPNGVNPGESLGILFNYSGSNNFETIIAAINSGTLMRVGLHVQGFATGGSESYIDNPTTVPEPATMLLLGCGLLGLAGFGRKRFGKGFSA